MRNVNEIILHCSATVEENDIGIETIRKWHINRGFNDIGYHYVIYIDGSVHEGRKEDKIGAHCTGRNKNSIGICYIGGLDKEKKPKDTRTEEQKISMYQLVDEILDKYKLTVDNVHCHYEYANKACPSFKIEDFREEFQNWKSLA